jgi:CO dehydrogenase nickel-insertion accessory protein CooC1
VLPNKIKDEEIESYISKKLREKGLEARGVVCDDFSITLSWLEGEPLQGRQANKDIMAAVKRWEQEVKEHQGSL